MFDEKKTVTVEGEVKEFQFTNPHSWLLVDVKDKDGKVTTWGFEAEGPSTLARAGIRPSDFKAGYPAEDHRQPDEGRPSRGHLGERRPRRRQGVRPACGVRRAERCDIALKSSRPDADLRLRAARARCTRGQ